MDIIMIENTIQELENSETTFDNIKQLADLYIVRDKFKDNVVKSELSDILPAYSEYIKIKKQYQMGEISEGVVIKHLKYVCTEIEEFLDTLYKCTDMLRERKCIKEMINSIEETFKDR